MKYVVVGVSDRVYERLLQLALASGKALEDYCRGKLGVESLEREEREKFDAHVQDANRERLRKEHAAEMTRAKPVRYIVKLWKSVRKQRIVEFRSGPVTEFEAIYKLQDPGKVGQFRLEVWVEQRDARSGMWRRVKDEKDVFYRSRKLHKRAVNRALGFDYYKASGKASPPSPAPPGP